MFQPDKSKDIVVIGDVMLDEYVIGSVQRFSAESCCPIFSRQTSDYCLGGAANVAYQMARAGYNVYLCGITGNDIAGEKVGTLRNQTGIYDNLIFRHDTDTTLKTRYVNNVRQQLLRVDHDCKDRFDSDEIESILLFLQNNSDHILKVVISDYDKGVITDDSCRTIIDSCNELGIETIVDIKVPRPDRYRNATLLKGNKKEMEAFFPGCILPAKQCLKQIKKQTSSRIVVMTMGQDGLIAVDNDDMVIEHRSSSVPVYDVTGAGDIVTAYIAMLSGYMPLTEVLRYANMAAGRKVEHRGNSYIDVCDIVNGSSKVKDIHSLLNICKNKKVVFTNGCFDILHAGHVDLLRFAKSKGDVLVVGLNSDESVRMLKGDSRPINDLDMRIHVLSAIEYVDYILVFDDETPRNIIETLTPQVLVKGGDYTIKQIVGAEWVKNHGGEVISMPFSHHISTTKIISKTDGRQE